jgi:signal transduction histidine kinase
MTPDVPPAGGKQSRRFHALPRWLLISLAVLALIGTLWANLLLWPIEYLGYNVDLRSGEVVFLAPDSVAAQAGLRPGDRILSVYGEPWAELLYHWNKWPLIDDSSAQIPIVVERAGTLRNFLLPRQQPAFAFQVTKVVFILLAGACWVTGALLGLGRRHEVNSSEPVAAFWLVLASVLGSYLFVAYLSPPLLALSMWLLITILPALAIGIHVWFPARAVSRRRSTVARRMIVGSWLTSNALLFACWLVWRPSLADLLMQAWVPLVGTLLLTFVGAGMLLVEAYRQTQVPHIRRQVRLIAAACLFTAAVWLLFRVPPLLLNSAPLLPDALLDFVPVIIPLAYLVSGTATNLRALDRLVRHIMADLLAMALIAVAFGSAVLVVARAHPEVILWSAVGIGLLLYPLIGWTRRLRASWSNPDRSYAPLREARHQLTTSLDSTTLVAIVKDGIQRTFANAPFALYLIDPVCPKTLTLASQDQLPDLPPSLIAGTLTEHLLRGEPVIEARMVHMALRSSQLTAAEVAAVHHQGVALWCVVRRKPDDILALALIGTDGTLEPYCAEDRQEVLGLVDAASLAFAHSAAYERLVQAEARLRDLFRTMRRVQDETEADLVREIHDEIINIYVQENIDSLQHLLNLVSDQQQRAELELLLASEQGLSQALRTICERLHPIGLDDPRGLPSVLRSQVERAQARWLGSCCLTIVGEALPIAPTVALEIYRITREALANAMKHAAATTITVCLQYPTPLGGALILSITDNGRASIAVEPRPGHRGIWNMIESARAVGGDIAFDALPEGGTRVIARFPSLASDTREQPVAQILRQLATTA